MGDLAAIATAALIVHALSAVVWVGGMFFALVALRPATARLLEPEPRLELWAGVLGRFFAWIFVAIVLLLASGYAMILAVFGGFREIGLHVQIMQVTGIVMMLAFLHVYFAPWRRFRAALARRDHPAAARQLAQIRTIVALNLILGLATVAVGSSGRYWG